MTTQPAASFSADALLMASANLVGSILATNPNRLSEAADLMRQAYAAMQHFAAGLPNTTTLNPGRKAAVDVAESIHPGYIICLEDGKKLKMLKRYLKTNYNMTPEQYRQRWNLPATYPMVAPDYAKRRSQLARDIGLGKVGKPSAITRKERMQQAAAQRAA